MRETGAVFAFVTGLPLALFNGCLGTGPAEPARAVSGHGAQPCTGGSAPAVGVEAAPAGLEEFWQVSIDGGAPLDLAARLIPPSLAADPAVVYQAIGVRTVVPYAVFSRTP